MEPIDLVESLARLCELPADRLCPATVIDEIPGWSSLTFLGLIALIDQEYDVQLKPRELMGCATIHDLNLLVTRIKRA